MRLGSLTDESPTGNHLTRSRDLRRGGPYEGEPRLLLRSSVIAGAASLSSLVQQVEAQDRDSEASITCHLRPIQTSPKKAPAARVTSPRLFLLVRSGQIIPAHWSDNFRGFSLSDQKSLLRREGVAGQDSELSNRRRLAIPEGRDNAMDDLKVHARSAGESRHRFKS
jgi:hypothetical protein